MLISFEKIEKLSLILDSPQHRYVGDEWAGWKLPTQVLAEGSNRKTSYNHSKGQIISEQNCGVLDFPKKQ